VKTTRLASEGVEGIVASVHGVNQRVQLLAHGSVRDLPPPHGLVDDDLRPEQDALEAILRCWRLGTPADEEIYGSCG